MLSKLLTKKYYEYRVSVQIGDHRDKLFVIANSKREAANQVLMQANYHIHRVTRQGRRHHWWSCMLRH